ncbi:MAG: hypothetical protein ACOYON_05345 [Fimbriimonas sp.]
MKHLLTAVAVLACVPAMGGQTVTAESVVNKVHNHFKARFDDLSATKKGLMGTSRVELDLVKGHYTRSTPPGYDENGWTVGIAMYGTHGKPLKGNKLELRYSRFSKVAGPRGSGLAFAREALVQLQRDPRRVITKQKEGVRWVARAFTLTKPACLPCHSGMKVGDPVLVGVYTVAPIQTVRDRVKPRAGKA